MHLYMVLEIKIKLSIYIYVHFYKISVIFIADETNCIKMVY